MQIVIGTAGHIDHGKTALVKALTGTDTDHLAEEKARGMTIDLGFAYLDKFITIIDVPGHEKFIRNMVAGVSTIDIALLVVAADDGIMPQTKEHLHILKLLGLKKGIIAITKTDLINDLDWIDLIELELRELVSDTFLKDAPIFRTSVEKNEGIDDLKNEIIKYLDINFKGNENFIKVVKSSAFCSENNEIISDNYKITKDQKIGIIPPIGGG